MENFEDMKKMWDDLNERLSHLEKENKILARKVMEPKFKSVREKLIRKYGMFIILAIVMILYSIGAILFNPLVSDKYRIITFICWVVFFFFEGSLDFYLRQRVQDIDIYNSNLTEISRMALQNWKIHKLAVIIGLPMAIVVVILYGFAIQPNIFVIYGMVAGGVVGLIIGSFHLRKFYQYYKFMQSENDGAELPE